ncbi:hypothetical protein NQ318_015089 [Aromia moschata]|uniref:THAP-type domain-containing protein n=1 Tax=Aromia moschata TaxID=1265417 RepID=A0AAV8YZM1_9CUCU|nr:hypothetical protein NQ318_015089 [Aromia moschata]
MWSPMEKCWVPNCSNSKDRWYTKNFFPLPSSPRYREIWLALAGKRSAGLEEAIYFCQDHFDPNDVETYMDKFMYLKATATPYFNMPERICRTCMSKIIDGDTFCVLSSKVPCTTPLDIKSELLTCRPEPLQQVLSFCIPELNIPQDPLPLACYKCYHTVWLFYIFKLTCNAVEKNMLGKMTAASYGHVVVCRSCNTNSGTTFFHLKEETPLGKILKKMFLNSHPAGVVPLKVCLKCWNTLNRLQKFHDQCLLVEQKLQLYPAPNQPRHLPAPNESPISNIYIPPCPSGDNANYQPRQGNLRDIRRAVPPYQSTSRALPPPYQILDHAGPPACSTSASVIRFSGKLEEGTSLVESHPTLKDQLGANCQGTSSTLESAVGPSSPQSSSTSSSASEHQKMEVNEDGNKIDAKTIVQPPKHRLSLDEKLVLAELMLKHGAALKTEASSKAQFEAWVTIVREFLELGHERPLENIQRTWRCMKKRAELESRTVGPATRVDQLVMDYLRAPRSRYQTHHCR